MKSNTGLQSLSQSDDLQQEQLKTYVIQVMGGKEQRVVSFCNALIETEILSECFLPRVKQLRRTEGRWNKVEKLLFPGYVFILSAQPEEVKRELHKVPEMTHLLQDESMIIPLTDEEAEMLQHLWDNQHVVDTSEGYIIGGKVVVTDGPMKDMEGLIKRIDRHKRIAEIEVELFHRTVSMKLGLEIIEKR
jgi:transcription termination/antitermination protein NusG